MLNMVNRRLERKGQPKEESCRHSYRPRRSRRGAIPSKKPARRRGGDETRMLLLRLSRTTSLMLFVETVGWSRPALIPGVGMQFWRRYLMCGCSYARPYDMRWSESGFTRVRSLGLAGQWLLSPDHRLSPNALSSAFAF